jgi:zinc protease
VQRSPRRVDFGTGTRVAQIRMGWPTPGDDTDDAPVLVVLSDVLGTTGRRLQAEIRDRLGLVTAIGPSYFDFSDAGAFLISATAQPDRVEQVVEALAAQIQRVRDGDITEAEVAASKRAIAGRRALGDEPNFNQAAAAIAEVSGVLDSSDEYFARMRPVTAADVQRVARTWLDPVNFTLVVVKA